MILAVFLVFFISTITASVCTPEKLIEYRTDCQKKQHDESSSCVHISFDEEQCSCLYEIDFACWIAEKECLKKTWKCRTSSFDSKTKQCFSEADRRCMILEAISLEWLLQLEQPHYCRLSMKTDIVDSFCVICFCNFIFICKLFKNRLFVKSSKFRL